MLFKIKFYKFNICIFSINGKILSNVVSRQIGGVKVDLAHTDQETDVKPFVSVDKETQKRALNIISEYDIKGIIIGNPINMDGTYGKSSQSAKDIAINISNKIDIPVSLWDERLSTVGAFNLSSELDINVSKREKDIDKFAAAFILQGALDFIQN